MTGSIIISEDEIFSVRTVDFDRIAEVIRKRIGTSEVARKLLVTVDDHGMDMLYVHELSPIELYGFYNLLEEVRSEVSDTPGLLKFVDNVRASVRLDKRIADKF